MANTDVLYETFEIYLKKAKQCQHAGDLIQAKRCYINAAEQMVKLAKLSKGDLQTVRYQRAKNIMETAKALDSQINQPKTPGVTKPPVTGTAPSKPKKKPTLEEALDKLNSLEGLDNVKSHVLSWVDQIKVFEMRRQRGLPVPPMSYHMVFTGNPGTGKTTVARIMAEIYCALGIISEGHLVEVDRSHLVAGYVGQTAIKTQEVVKKAMGGVLFIDEAYALANNSDNDFGKECIDTLLKGMEDSRTDFVVIVAGYAAPMEPFIASNPGLRSRFKTFIDFSDYNGAELFSIFKSLCSKNSYKLSPGAEIAVESYLHRLYETRDEEFANARDVRNLFENIVTRQSKRIAGISSPSDDDMVTITESDLPFLKIPTDSAPRSTASVSKPDDTVPSIEKTTPEEKVLEDGAVFDSEFKFEWDNLPMITFDDVAGLEDVKDAVQMKVILPLKNPEAFEGYVKKNGGGLLLYGPPGTGKTMIAAAIANEINAKFCSVKPSDLLHQGAGQSEKSIRALFAQARQFPCAVIYFDEMDSISPKTTRSQYAKQLRSEFLSQLQGVESYGKDNGNILFLIAATNKPWDIDSAFIRPGRFGTRIYVGLPDSAARSYIVETRMAKIISKGIVKVAEDIPYDSIVERTEGFNCSDIANLMDKVEEISIRRGFKTGEKSIVKEDFDEAFSEITSSVQRADIEKLMEWTNENNT